MVWAIGLVTSLLGSSVLSDPVEEPFAGFNDLCGYPIIVTSTPSVAQAVVSETGRKVILIDPRLEAEDEKFRKVFLIAHECAHHRMGHAGLASRQQRILSSRVVRDLSLIHI